MSRYPSFPRRHKREEGSIPLVERRQRTTLGTSTSELAAQYRIVTAPASTSSISARSAVPAANVLVGTTTEPLAVAGPTAETRVLEDDEIEGAKLRWVSHPILRTAGAHGTATLMRISLRDYSTASPLLRADCKPTPAALLGSYGDASRHAVVGGVSVRPGRPLSLSSVVRTERNPRPLARGSGHVGDDLHDHVVPSRHIEELALRCISAWLADVAGFRRRNDTYLFGLRPPSFAGQVLSIRERNIEVRRPGPTVRRVGPEYHSIADRSGRLARRDLRKHKVRDGVGLRGSAQHHNARYDRDQSSDPMHVRLHRSGEPSRPREGSPSRRMRKLNVDGLFGPGVGDIAPIFRSFG
jgi:hypothetical protein